MKASDIKYIVIHCTAGFQNAEKVQDFFTRPKSQGGRGWKTGGYHRIVETDGTIKEMYPFSTMTNGVIGYNDKCLHISYVGGVKSVAGKLVAEDSRTPQQKTSIQKCIVEAVDWLKANGKDVTRDLLVLGHRDFSKDQNGNGSIESWERIKECPSFDAISEYRLFSATNEPVKLPNP